MAHKLKGLQTGGLALRTSIRTYIINIMAQSIPTARILPLGPREEDKYPTHGTRLKFYLMIITKDIPIPVVLRSFSHGF